MEGETEHNSLALPRLLCSAAAVAVAVVEDTTIRAIVVAAAVVAAEVEAQAASLSPRSLRTLHLLGICLFAASKGT